MNMERKQYVTPVLEVLCVSSANEMCLVASGTTDDSTMLTKGYDWDFDEDELNTTKSVDEWKEW